MKKKKKLVDKIKDIVEDEAVKGYFDYDIDYDLVKNCYDLWKWHNSSTKGDAPKPRFKKEFETKFSLKKG